MITDNIYIKLFKLGLEFRVRNDQCFRRTECIQEPRNLEENVQVI